MGLHQTYLQEQIEVEVGAVVGQQVPEEPLWVPVVVGHGRFTQDTDEGVGGVGWPARILKQKLLQFTRCFCN